MLHGAPEEAPDSTSAVSIGAAASRASDGKVYTRPSTGLRHCPILPDRLQLELETTTTHWTKHRTGHGTPTVDNG